MEPAKVIDPFSERATAVLSGPVAVMMPEVPGRPSDMSAPLWETTPMLVPFSVEALMFTLPARMFLEDEPSPNRPAAKPFCEETAMFTSPSERKRPLDSSSEVAFSVEL